MNYYEKRGGKFERHGYEGPTFGRLIIEIENLCIQEVLDHFFLITKLTLTHLSYHFSLFRVHVTVNVQNLVNVDIHQ